MPILCQLKNYQYQAAIFFMSPVGPKKARKH